MRVKVRPWFIVALDVFLDSLTRRAVAVFELEGRVSPLSEKSKGRCRASPAKARYFANAAVRRRDIYRGDSTRNHIFV